MFEKIKNMLKKEVKVAAVTVTAVAVVFVGSHVETAYATNESAYQFGYEYGKVE